MSKLMTMLVPGMALLISGCAGLNPGQNRAQSQNYYDCLFNFEGVPETAGDMFAQAMMIEHSGGTESDTATQTQTTDVPVDVSVPTGTDAITALVGAGAKGITEGLVTEKEAAAVDPDCPDGDCAPAK